MSRQRNLPGLHLWLVLLAATGLGATQTSTGLNGFSLEGLSVARSTIQGGGPPRDGIPSVEKPGFVPAAAATWVTPGNPVLGVVVGEEARAYPVHLIERHQVVNDVVGGVPILVSYDPLAGSPISYRRQLGDRTLSFGVSGLLHHSNFLLYDRETMSLWVQFTGQAISGPLVGKTLERVVTRQEPLGSWLQRVPKSKVMERPDPKNIDYRYSPYQRYWTQNKILFPVPAEDPRFHAKELVLGVEVGGASRAYLGSLVTRSGGTVQDEFAGHSIRFSYDSSEATFRWEIPDEVRVTESYWFAWKAFHPETEVWNDPGDAAPVAD